MCFALGRSIALALTVLASPTYIIPIVGQLIMALVLCVLFWLYAWNLVSESLGRMNICTFRDQGSFALQHGKSFVSFGAMATLLEVVPILDIVFMAGSAFGAAILFERFFEAEARTGHRRSKLISTV